MGDFVFNETKIEGVYLIDVGMHSDDRGYFMESYNKRDFDEAGLSYDFVQDNQSCSQKGAWGRSRAMKVSGSTCTPTAPSAMTALMLSQPLTQRSVWSM